MTREVRFDRAPDLRRIYASALVSGGRATSGPLPEVRAVRRGVRVDLDTLADYARVCGFPVGSALPLTYPHVLAFPLQMALMSERDFPLGLAGAVHLANVITSTRPIAVEESFDLTVRAENLRPHRRGRQVDLVSEVSVQGEVVWTGVSTYLSKESDTGTRDEGAAGDASEPPSLDGLASVEAGPTWRLTEGVGRRYARVSGDWNPIHLHALTARPLGFSTAIAHGMYSYARVVAALGPRIPTAGVTSRVWFRKPLRLPSTVRLRTAFETNRALSLVHSANGDHVHLIVEHSW
ncbi:MaoC/PaaZ C-terminal domain-containing protein [Intrasporangium sp. DVR]